MDSEPTNRPLGAVLIVTGGIVALPGIALIIVMTIDFLLGANYCIAFLGFPVVCLDSPFWVAAFGLVFAGVWLIERGLYEWTGEHLSISECGPSIVALERATHPRGRGYRRPAGLVVGAGHRQPAVASRQLCEIIGRQQPDSNLWPLLSCSANEPRQKLSSRIFWRICSTKSLLPL